MPLNRRTARTYLGLLDAELPQRRHERLRLIVLEVQLRPQQPRQVALRSCDIRPKTPPSLMATTLTGIVCPVRSEILSPVVTFPTTAVLSSDPEAIWSPLLHATMLTFLVWPRSSATLSPVVASQMMQVSFDPDTICEPVGLHATLVTFCERHLSSEAFLPVAASQMIMVLSHEDKI